MDVLLVAASGVAIVLALILLFRLHPLLSLLIGALFVFAATPQAVLLKNGLLEQSLEVVALVGDNSIGVDANSVTPGQFYVLDELADSSTPRTLTLEPATTQLEPMGELGELPRSAKSWLAPSPGSRPGAINLKVGDRLVTVEAVVAMQVVVEKRWSTLGEKLAAGFSKTFLKLGIPVTMAAIVGACLLESGAAARLVAAIIALFGPRGTAPALTLSGFILGVPVFFDNVFYLLLPLAKAVGRKRPEGYLTAVMAIIVGATMAHSLVPPTPGPLLVAAAMKVNVGTMMIGGFIVGGLAATIGFAYGTTCRRWVRLTPEMLSDAQVTGPTGSDIPQPLRSIPLWLAALPVATPIFILSGAEVLKFYASANPDLASLQALHQIFTNINDPGLIFIGTAILSILILRYTSTSQTVGKSVSRGIVDAGTIVLLTCAGGAFGAALQQLDLATSIGEQFSELTTPWGILCTAFLLTAVIRVAQGSATVAMITSVAIVAPLMDSIELPYHPVYLALAIGCGSKPLPWMNDSGFWQVATMTGLNTTQTLKTFSVALTLMGIAGFGVTLIGAWLFPFV